MATKKRKNNNPAPSADPAFLACFETAILDYDILTKQVEDKGMVLKHHNDYKRLAASGMPNLYWITMPPYARRPAPSLAR